MKNLNQFKPGQGEEIIEKSHYTSPRSKSREVAMQALYQWQLNHSDMSDITQQFSTDGRFQGIDMAFYHEIVQFVSNHVEALDEVLIPLLDRQVSRIDPIEKAIMRMGVYELKQKPEIPYKVVINEAVELAKRYGSEDGHKFVNGILDKVAQDLRADEVASEQTVAQD